MNRPPQCQGCPCNPDSADYDPVKSGPFVAPYDGTASVGEPGAGSFDVDVVAIGMAPSFREVEEGQPMVGPTYHEMRRGLGDMLDRIKIRKTNVVNCRTWKPGKTVDRVNRDPTVRETKPCALRWLVPELRAMAEQERRTGKPVHLWILGGLAMEVVLQKKFGTFSGSKSSRGQRINRKNVSYDVLADRIEMWATKTASKSRKKERTCKECGEVLTQPRILKCAACKEKKNAKQPAPSVQQPGGD